VIAPTRTGRDLRHALRSLPFKGLSLALERACGLGVVLLSAPRLGEAAFGRFAFASAVTAMLAFGTDLGLGLWTTRTLARHDELHDGHPSQVVRVALAIRSAAALPYSLAIAGVIVFVARPGERLAIALLGIAALLNAFVDQFAAVLRGCDRFADEARLNTTRALLTVGAGGGAILARGTLVSLCGGLVFASAVAAITGAVSLLGRGLLRRPTRREPDRALAGRALRQSLPIWFAALLSLMYFKVDTLFVRSFSGDVELGAYNAAYRFFEGSMMLPSVLLSVAFPRLARAHFEPAAQRRLEGQLGALLAASGVVVGTLFLAGSGPLVRLVFGPQFERAVASLRVLALGVPLVYLNFGLTHFVIARDLGRFMPWFSVVMLVLNVALDLALVPRGGGPGAAWATALSELALTACCLAALRWSRREHAPGRTPPSTPGEPRTGRTAA
jgi:O-antigen/teichoic acid export membrane protein